MRITHLQIENFRNISQIDIELSPVLNGFWGNNGQGKTNILEAIFSACKLKSFRPYSSKKDWYPRLIHNTPQTKVEIFLETNRQYGHKIQLANDDGKRWQSFWDDKKASAQQIQSKVPILAFSPDDHSLIRGGPEGRRDFFDALLIDIAPGYAEILQRYHKALKQRNELIRSFENDKKKVIPELSTWTTLLIQEGFDLSLIRREFWPLFRSQFLSTTQKLFKNEFPGLKIEFFHDLSTVDNSWTKEEFHHQLQLSWEKDLATGWTHRGPHRDEIIIELEEGLLAKNHASQSQARLLALSLKWSHAECLKEQQEENPIFLIDDFSSELDAKHRSLLLNLIHECKGQLFISGTEESLVDLNNFSQYSYWRVEKGLLESQKAY